MIKNSYKNDKSFPKFALLPIIQRKYATEAVDR
jgi:hypothetical protein